MPTSSIPLDIKSFLIDCIDSVSHLEVLLMLSSNPEDWFSAEQVSKELRSNVTSATTHLQNLNRRGLLIIKDGTHYKYEPNSSELEERVKKLTAIYAEKPVAVVTCIFDKPNDKLKGFADAFKFKKD